MSNDRQHDDFSYDSNDAGKTPSDDAASRTWRKVEHLIPDAVRKLLLTGIGAAFMTEEGLRGAITDLKLPKEVVAYLLSQAERSKRDLMQTLARELRSFLNDVDVTGVLRRVLAGMTVELHTQIKFVQNADHLEPKIEMHEITHSSPDDETSCEATGETPIDSKTQPQAAAPKKPSAPRKSGAVRKEKMK